MSHRLSPTSPFLAFALAAQDIADLRGTNDKITRFKAYLEPLSVEDRKRAVRFLGEGAFSATDVRRVQLGHRTIAMSAANFCELDYERVFKPSRTALGSSSETIARLLDFWPDALKKRTLQAWTLADVESFCIELAETKKREDKEKLLHKAFVELSGLEVKYFLRIIQQGSLRIGFELKSILKGIAETCHADQDEVRYAHMMSGTLEKTIELASAGRLSEVRFKLFHPLAFMLASPIESRVVENWHEYIAEEKFDGMRCQLHADGTTVRLFSRDQNEITEQFPEVTAHFGEKELHATVLDGELCVFYEETIRPFNELQQRMGLKKPSASILKQYPVLFIAYDMLVEEGVTLFDRPLMERKERLRQLAKTKNLAYSTWNELQNESSVQTLFKQAKAHGNEGLMLKRKDSVYEYGQRGKSWLKVKEPGGSLDTVMMYAHAGSGKRGGTYSDFTLGVRVKDDDRYEEEFIPIGKAYGGYSNEELKALNKAIKPLVVEKYGPTLGLKPGIVIELEFDDIQLNKRTKAGYTLRFPRFKAIRWDLKPEDCDTLKDVERLYREKTEQERVENSVKPSFVVG